MINGLGTNQTAYGYRGYKAGNADTTKQPPLGEKAKNNKPYTKNTEQTLPAEIYTQPAAVEIQSDTVAKPDETKTISAPNTSLRWYDPQDVNFIYAMQGRVSGTAGVRVEKNGLLGLMEEIEKALANGESLTSVLQAHTDKTNSYADEFDTFWIDPNTGNVMMALPPNFAIVGGRGIVHSIQSDDAAWDLAYDLQTFLKIRVFGETGGFLNEAEAESFIAGIKESQAHKDYSRFSAGGSFHKLLSTSQLEESEKAEAQSIYDKIKAIRATLTESKDIGATIRKSGDLVDELIKFVGKHQDKLHDELKRLHSNSLYKHKEVLPSDYVPDILA